MQASQGEFIESGRQDILSIALGTDEHPGRVRAMGRGYGIKSVFGHAKCRQTPTEDVQRMVDAVVAQALQKQSSNLVLCSTNC